MAGAVVDRCKYVNILNRRELELIALARERFYLVPRWTQYTYTAAAAAEAEHQSPPFEGPAESEMSYSPT